MVEPTGQSITLSHHDLSEPVSKGRNNLIKMDDKVRYPSLYLRHVAPNSATGGSVGPLPAAPVAATCDVSKVLFASRPPMATVQGITGNVSGGGIDTHVTSGTECAVGHEE